MPKNKNLFIIIAVAVVLGTLLAWPRMNDPYKAQKKMWKASGIACLSNGHVNLSQHIHPWLAVTIDGAKETIPASIGNVSGCMAEMHTHDASGEIHIESIDYGKTFTLAQFFKVWDKPLMREGYTITVKVNGADVADPAALILKDKEQVAIEYVKAQ